MTDKPMLMLKGEPRTSRIYSYYKDKNGKWWVTYKADGKWYPCGYNLVVLEKPTEVDIDQTQIYNEAGNLLLPERVLLFTHYLSKFYRFIFRNNVIAEYSSSQVRFKTSALKDDHAKRVFNYLAEVSKTDRIEMENGDPVSLHEKYEKISFIDEDAAWASFLTPERLKHLGGLDNALFPFRSNKSQMQAVNNAFLCQFSVIQGPPGTGKTQTILNILSNIIAQDKTILIVSNNNSAVENVQEKLEKEGLGFLVAKLGKRENKNFFLANQPPYPDMSSWKLQNVANAKAELKETTQKLQEVFLKQEQLALDRQLLTDLKTEHEHFIQENLYDESWMVDKKLLPSDELMDLWLRQEAVMEHSLHLNFFQKIIDRIRQFFFKKKFLKRFGKDVSVLSSSNLLLDIMGMYYLSKIQELEREITELERYLDRVKADELGKRQAVLSMKIFKDFLFDKYKGGSKERVQFKDTDLNAGNGLVAKEYPVVLSTTFSAVGTLRDYQFDYLIMDEASQVSVESGALALSCAKNAVIVGDMKQLGNIVDRDAAKVIDEINKNYTEIDNYNALNHSFLSSVIAVLPQAPQTLLKEHYRCNPLIINFCNQKFYGGNLLIMTHAKDGGPSMEVIKTVQGNHARCLASEVVRGVTKYDYVNQREVDEFKALLEGELNGAEDIGVITPYRGQVKLFNKELHRDGLEVDTVHKYQGREKDVVVMSSVLNAYNDFCDDANLINVAVSRAKDKFILITNGNDANPENSNLGDLIHYVQYHEGTVVKSKLHSIFDFLYKQYTDKRMKFLQNKKQVSSFDSENIAYDILLSRVLPVHEEWASLDVVCHYPLYRLIQDRSLLDVDEYNFVSGAWSHLDFLIYNRVTKNPVLAIEVDGFAYHHEGTDQEHRDRLKDSILEKYGINFLRIPTTGSHEIEKMTEALEQVTGVGEYR